MRVEIKKALAIRIMFIHTRIIDFATEKGLFKTSLHVITGHGWVGKRQDLCDKTYLLGGRCSGIILSPSKIIFKVRGVALINCPSEGLELPHFKSLGISQNSTTNLLR